MAIQGVSFMGREGCIKPTAEKVAKDVKTYMGKEPIGEVEKVAKEVETKIRKTDLKSYVDSHAPLADDTKDVSGDKIAEAWKAAHGIK